MLLLCLAVTGCRKEPPPPPQKPAAQKTAQPLRVPPRVTVRFPPHDPLEWTVAWRQEKNEFLVLSFTLRNLGREELGVPLTMGILPGPPPPYRGPAVLDAGGAVVVENVTRPDGSVFRPTTLAPRRAPQAVTEKDLHWIAGKSTFRPPEIRIPAQALGLDRPGPCVLLLQVNFPLHWMDLSGLGKREARVWASGPGQYFAVPFVWE